MKNLSKYGAVLALVLMYPGISSAEGDGDVNAWRDCGIGAMIFPETPTGAVISNIIWDLGTTALTSAVGSKDTCKGANVQTAQYIYKTYANLEEETAKGEGQHVTAMLDMMGCENSAQPQIISAIRADFSESVNASAYAGKSRLNKAEDFYNLVQNKVSGQFSAQCQII